MKNFPIYLIILLFFSSCSQNLDIPFPAHEPKLTLHAFLSPNQPIDLYLTRTYSILEEPNSKDIAVSDAKVELWKNGSKIDEMKYVDTTFIDSSGFSLLPTSQQRNEFPTFYGAKYIPSTLLSTPKAGDIYRFVVKHDTYGEAEARTQIPSPAEVRNVVLRRNELIFREVGQDVEEKWSSLDISIKDPQGTGNFYNFYIGAQTDIEEPLLDTVIVRSTVRWSWIKSEVLSYPNGFSFGYNRSLSDETFDGQTYSHLWWYKFPESYSTETSYDLLRIRAITLTKEYADYLEKLNIQTDNRLGGIQGAFVPSESVGIPSNVKGGYGIVGSFNIAEDFEIELK